MDEKARRNPTPFFTMGGSAFEKHGSNFWSAWNNRGVGEFDYYQTLIIDLNNAINKAMGDQRAPKPVDHPTLMPR